MIPAKTNSAVSPTKAGEIIEAVIARGDIAELDPQERAKYYVRVCESIGVNPLTRPLAYLTLQGKTILYALKECTDQLRSIHSVSVTDISQTERDGVFIVTAKVVDKDGRIDVSTGAVHIQGLKGVELANALMKAETKAKRRATLSVCGLGFLDETEIEDMMGATLPKKDAKDIYTKLQGEVDKLANLKDFEAWNTGARERISVLPADWQQILRLRMDEKWMELKPKAQVVEKDDAIPPMLDRRKPQATPQIDLAGIIKRAAVKLHECKDGEQLLIAWEAFVEPHAKAIPVNDYEELMGVYRTKEAELAP